jgi:hypothetical protein
MYFLMRKKPVFYTLLGISGFLGTTLIVLIATKQFTLSIIQFLIPMVIGMIAGLIVYLIDSFQYKEMGCLKYKPSVTYSIIISIIILLIVIFRNLRIYLFIIFLFYVITLAILFRLYEVKTNQKGMTWIDLLGK